MIATSKNERISTLTQLETTMAPSRIEPATLHSTKRIFSASFFQLSQHPGIVAVWFNHPKSSCHFMVRYDPDQDVGLFWSKQHRSTARVTARCHCVQSSSSYVCHLGFYFQLTPIFFTRALSSSLFAANKSRKMKLVDKKWVFVEQEVLWGIYGTDLLSA